MKRLLIAACLTAMTAAGACAQAVLGYSVTQSEGAFVTQSAPVTVFDGSTCSAGDFDFLRYTISPDGIVENGSSAKGFDLGFDLDYCGTTYRNFLVNPSGYIILGNGDVAFQSFMGPNFLTYGSDYSIIGFKDNDGETYSEATRVTCSTEGTGDDARLVVTFTGLGFKVSGLDGAVPVDMQLVVDKKGQVNYILKNFSNLKDAGKQFPLTLSVRKGDNYVLADGASGSLTAARDVREGAALFGADTPDGTTVTLNIPQPCVTPAAQPTELLLTSTTSDIEGSFTAAGDADTYLVVYSKKGETLTPPTDGVTYDPKGDDMLGAAKVACFGAETKFNVLQLEGGVDYTFTVYAANSYGLEGPKYNVVSPLTADVLTKPAAADSIAFSDPAADSFRFEITSNAADDEVIVLYNSYCERDNYGDHGLFGAIPADVKAGDVLPVPEDFRPEWAVEGAPAPENAGTVAFVGKAGETLTLEGLLPSTAYYVGVYTRDAQGNITTKPLYGGYSTILENPYDGDSYNFPRYGLPFGWSGTDNDNEAGTYGFRDEQFVDRDNNVTRGTQVIQQRCNVTRGDATNGKVAWMVPVPVDVNDRHIMAKFEYSITASPTRFATGPYNDWAEGDLLEIQVSEDNGGTWTALTSYNPDNNPKQEAADSYVSIAADLNAYRGKTVLLRYYWKTYSAAGFGTSMYVDRFSLTQAEFPAVPELTVDGITDNSAVVSWVSKQTDYELVYQEKNSDEYVTVKIRDARTYTMHDLKAETEYEVKVRGVLVDEESGEETGFSEWSDPLVFATAGYPAAEAPVNLKSDTETLASLGYAILEWDAVKDAEKYEVAYRLASSTEWVYEETVLPTLMLTGLESDTEYVWKVKAYCTYSRVSDYSAQARFRTPATSGVGSVDAEGVTVTGKTGCILVEGAEGLSVRVYSISGRLLATGVSGEYSAAPGIYLVTVGTRTHKVVVR